MISFFWGRKCIKRYHYYHCGSSTLAPLAVENSDQMVENISLFALLIMKYTSSSAVFFLTHIISLSPLFHFSLNVSVRGFYSAILSDMHLAHYLKQILILCAVAYTVDELSWNSAEKQIKQSDRKGKKKQHAEGGFAGFESRKIETDLIVFMPLNVTAG